MEDDPNIARYEDSSANELPDEVDRELEVAIDAYASGEERRENEVQRTERLREHDEEVPIDAEEQREYDAFMDEVDREDSEEATEYIHEWIEERHQDIWEDILAGLGAVGAIAGIAGVILLVK